MNKDTEVDPLNEDSSSESEVSQETNEEERKSILQRPFQFKKVIKVVIDKEGKYTFYEQSIIIFIRFVL